MPADSGRPLETIRGDAKKRTIQPSQHLESLAARLESDSRSPGDGLHRARRPLRPSEDYHAAATETAARPFHQGGGPQTSSSSVHRRMSTPKARIRIAPNLRQTRWPAVPLSRFRRAIAGCRSRRRRAAGAVQPEYGADAFPVAGLRPRERFIRHPRANGDGAARRWSLLGVPARAGRCFETILDEEKVSLSPLPKRDLRPQQVAPAHCGAATAMRASIWVDGASARRASRMESIRHANSGEGGRARTRWILDQLDERKQHPLRVLFALQPSFAGTPALGLKRSPTSDCLSTTASRSTGLCHYLQAWRDCPQAAIRQPSNDAAKSTGTRQRHITTCVAAETPHGRDLRGAPGVAELATSEDDEGPKFAGGYHEGGFGGLPDSTPKDDQRRRLYGRRITDTEYSSDQPAPGPASPSPFVLAGTPTIVQAPATKGKRRRSRPSNTRPLVPP
uniref:Uncharacterized protein n=1 Tax=Mycena chlorophos TaxID=658473 RepID=A0ABQ0L7R4_MYCCL|nr:predicted protein [Mycena chlorophos]